MNRFSKTCCFLTTVVFLAACGLDETKPATTTTTPDAGTTTTTTTPDAGTTTTTTTPTDTYTATDVVRIVGSDMLFNSTYLRGESSGYVRGDFVDTTKWDASLETAKVNSVQPGWLTVPVARLMANTLAVGSSRSHRFTLIGVAGGANDWAQYGNTDPAGMANKHCLELTSDGKRNIKIKVTRDATDKFTVACDGTY